MESLDIEENQATSNECGALLDSSWSNSIITLMLYHRYKESLCSFEYCDDYRELLGKFPIDETVLSNMSVLDLYLYLERKLDRSAEALLLFLMGYPLKRTSKVKVRNVMSLAKRVWNGTTSTPTDTGDLYENGESLVKLLQNDHRMLAIDVVFIDKIEARAEQDKEYSTPTDESAVPQSHSEKNYQDHDISVLISKEKDFKSRVTEFLKMASDKDQKSDGADTKKVVDQFSEEATKLLLKWDSLVLSDASSSAQVPKGNNMNKRMLRQGHVRDLLDICDQLDQLKTE
jgi:hypothetical protein